MLNSTNLPTRAAMQTVRPVYYRPVYPPHNTASGGPLQYHNAPVATRDGLRSNSIQKKIQIQMQKQEEETRLFNETMQDAQMVKQYAGGQAQGHQQHHGLHHANIAPNQLPHVSRSQHLIPSYPPYPRGGSLPNVNQMANQAAGIDLRNALDHLEMLTSDRDPSGRGMQRHPSPSPHTQSGQRRHYSPKRPMEYEVSRMPSYLSPPESSQLTKRAHSDSAIHQSANSHMMHDGSAQQMHMVNFTPTRRSPVPPPPEKMTDANFNMWNDPSKMVQNQNRPKSCEIPAMSAYAAEQSRQQQHGQHLLSPTSIQPTPITNPSTGSLPDLTNPAMNFPTLVSPLDPEDNSTQSFVHNNGHPVYMSSQIRAPGSHSPSNSPQPRRASAMRSATDSHTGSMSSSTKGQKQKQQTQHAPPSGGNVYAVNNERGGNHMGYAPYQPQQQQAQNSQTYGQYRSNSNSPNMHELANAQQPPATSNPASPGASAGLPNMSYSQDQQYLEMHQTVQQKFEQIDIDQAGNHQQLDPYMNMNMNNLMYDLLRSQASEMGQGQIPNIIFTGADDQSGLRDEYSSFFASSGGASSSHHPFPHNGTDPGYSSQESQDHHVDLMAELSKLDQYDLGMLTDETLRNMVDPEAEEQFRLDSNVP